MHDDNCRCDDELIASQRLTRRQWLSHAVRITVGAAALLPLAACDRLRPSDESGVTIAEATPAPALPPPAPTSTPVRTGATPPEVTLAPTAVGQGETALILVRHAEVAGGSVQILGQRVPLIRERGVCWAVVGAGLLAPIGPEEATLVTRDAAGAVLHELVLPFDVVAVARPVDYLNASPEVTAVLTVEAAETEAALRTYEQFNLFQSRPRWGRRLLQPCEGFITTAFGQGRSINGGPVTGQHSGTDIANAEGTPIVAAAAGRVAWVGPMPIRGNSVLVDHGAGVVTGYHHLLETEVEVGAYVEAGEQIARMGSTGFSTGPHLHWEMTVYGVNVDPMTWTQLTFLPPA